MGEHAEGVTFEVWKERFRADQRVGQLALRQLVVACGLAYGRVNILGDEGAAHLSRFFIDRQDGVTTSVVLQPAAELAGNRQYITYEKPVAGWLLSQCESVEVGHMFSLCVYDPRTHATGDFNTGRVRQLTVHPYKAGEERKLSERFEWMTAAELAEAWPASTMHELGVSIPPPHA